MLLHVHELGDPAGEPLVCVHGVTSHGLIWRLLAERHWSHRRVVAVDLRGHGRSDWEPPWTFATHVADLAETAAALGLEQPDWVGHSFGGRLVLELAAQHPELVRHAGLVDPAIQILPHVALSSAADQLRDPVYTDREAYVAERLARYPDSPRAEMEREAGEHLEPQPDGSLRRRTCQPAMAAIFGELASEPPPPETLRAPALLLFAPAYGLVRPQQVDAYRAALGDRLEVVEVPGMHMVMWDALAETGTAVERLLAR